MPAADLGFFTSIVQAGLAEQAVMAVLFAGSIASWAIIGHKVRVLRRAMNQSEQFLQSFWSTKRLEALYQRADALGQSPVSQVFRAGYVELAKLRKQQGSGGQPAADDMALSDLESVERSMKRASLAEAGELGAWIPFLATMASTAPFVGLLGTVIGIVHAFSDIGATGNANLATVAPAIGGALVATAFGLFAAIPAAVSYNYFAVRLQAVESEMNSFAADFLNILKRHFR